MTRKVCRRSLGIGLVFIFSLLVLSDRTWGTTDEALGDFLRKIQDAKGEIRRDAWENAGPLGAKAVAPLGRLLAGEDHNVAKAAERALEVVAHHASRPGADSERKAVSAALATLTKQENAVSLRDKALRLLGSTAQDESVAAIAPWLYDKEVWEAARWALERIPGPAADAALIRALTKPPRWENGDPSRFQEAIISTLGAKAASSAAAVVIRFLGSEEQTLRIVALDALGRIGNPRTAPEISRIAQSASGREKAIAFDNYLRIADRLTTSGGADEAFRMYHHLFQASEEEVPRCAAIVGMGHLPLNGALRTLLQALSDPSHRIQNAAASSLTTMQGRNVGSTIAAAIGGAKPELKPALMRILVERRDPLTVRVLSRTIQDANATVRLAALELVGQLASWHRPAVSLKTTFERPLLKAVSEESEEIRRTSVRSYLLIAEELAREAPSVARGMYRRALTMEVEDQARQLALQGIAAIPSETDLDVVTSLRKHPALRDEATRTYIAIAAEIARRQKDRGVEMLKNVVESPSSVEIIQLAASELNKLGFVIPIAKKSGFLTRWWLIGPFPSPNNAAWEQELPPEKKIDLEEAVQSDGKTLRWKEVRTDDLQGRVNLAEQFDPDQQVAAYAYIEIKVPQATDVKFKIGSDDSVACWLNGTRIHANNLSRGLSVDQDVVETSLPAGKNTILVKVLNEAGPWEFCLRLTDRQETPIDTSRLTP